MNLNKKILEILSHIRTHDFESPGSGPLSKVSSGLRLFGIILIIIFSSLSRNMIFSFTITAILLLEIAFMKEKAMLSVIKTVLIADAFSALILLPAVFMNHPGTLLTILIKVNASVGLLSVFAEENSWKNITSALLSCHMPELFIMILDMTIRFMVILGRYSNRLLEAVNLRSPGKRNWKNSGAGGILGTTFLKAEKMAGETSKAMDLRCFNGRYETMDRHKINIFDIIYFISIIILIILYIKVN